MEDFGYSKHKEESAASGVVKRAFLIGATLFSVACFVYVTINAYYFFSQDGGNANIETIKAEADPIKVVETDHADADDAMKIDDSIYEDIFGNRKHGKEKEIKIMESSSPALPPKPSAELVEKKSTNNNEKFVTSSSEDQLGVNKNKAGQIIVYSDVPQEKNNNILLEKSKAEKTSAKAAANEAIAVVSKPASTGKKYIRVQIAALTSKKMADEYSDRLENLYPGLFSGLKSFIEQVDLGKRGIFYRLQVGNFYDQVRAEEFCNRYVAQTQKSKADCIVVE